MTMAPYRPFAWSFSLRGNERRYTDGLRRNLEAIKSWDAESVCVLHVDDTVEVDLAGWQVEHWPRDLSLECHFWRFRTAGQRQYSAVFCRDLDAVVGPRELAAVEEFLAGPHDWHVMRDHYYHTAAGGCPHAMMGGMWGCRPHAWPEAMDFCHLVEWWTTMKRPFARWSDCWFLNRFVYPFVRWNGLEHDGAGSAWGGKPFPTPRQGDAYVGETVLSGGAAAVG